MTESRPGEGPGSHSDWRLRFVQDMGGLSITAGLPRATMRVLGWMIVCDPIDQTARDIQQELNLSAGSVSAAVRALCGVGMLERLARPGDRRIHYRLSERGWAAGFERRFRILGELRAVAERALHGADGEEDDRLQNMHGLLSLWEEAVVSLLRSSVAAIWDDDIGNREGTKPIQRDA